MKPSPAARSWPALASLASYWLTRDVLTRIYSVSSSDDTLGGMWAVIATVFVYRDSYARTAAAALSRIAATAVSFVLCLAYLLVLPPSIWGMAVLIGIGELAVTLIGRPSDAVTTGITTAVVMVVALLSPHDACAQPILRFFDTLIGIAHRHRGRPGRRLARPAPGPSARPARITGPRPAALTGAASAGRGP